jgi:acyl dehydratase
MPLDRSVIGTVTGKQRVVVERGHVWKFATAVNDEDPIYWDPKAAASAGLAGPTVPPTYGFVLSNGAAYPELQPDDSREGGEVMLGIIGQLRANGGMILHGEQEFVYHRPIISGEVLLREGRVADIYERESKGKRMTFVITEETYTDERTGEPVLTTRFNLIHRV